MTLYYTVVDAIQNQSNYVNDKEKTVFKSSGGDKYIGTQRVRENLWSRGLLRFAPTLMQLQFNSTPSSAMQIAVREALTMCDTLDRSGQEPLQFRAVILKKQLAAVLMTIIPQMAAQLQAQNTATVARLASNIYKNWDDFCPVLVTDNTKAVILESEMPRSEKLAKLLKLAEGKRSQKDYTKANQLHISIMSLAQDWYQEAKGTASASQALQSLTSAHHSYYALHRNHTQIAFFEASAVYSHQTTLLVHVQDYSAVIELAESFKDRHPDFAIPRMQEHIFSHAATAARHRGMAEKEWQFTQSRQEWERYCNFTGEEGLIASGGEVSDHFLAMREIIVQGQTYIEWGHNAIRVLLRWVGSEFENGRLSKEECQLLLGPQMGGIPDNNPLEYIADDIEVPSLADFLFGTLKAPSDIDRFWEQYKRIRDWILSNEQLPSLAARLFVLKILAQSRVFRVRLFLQERRATLSQTEAALLKKETETVADIERFEETQNGVHRDQEDRRLWISLHTVSLKCYAVRPEGSPRIIEEPALLPAIADCNKLIERRRNNQDLVREYEAVAKLLELRWQHWIHFRTSRPTDLLPDAEHAEALFIEIRKLTRGLDPTDALVAKATMSQEYAQRQHYNFALASLFVSFELEQADNRVSSGGISDVKADFISWALRSKGRSFSDILQPDARTNTERVASSSEYGDARETSEVPPESATDDSANHLVNKLKTVDLETSSATAVKIRDKLASAIQAFPKDVVVIDFINVTLSYSSARFAAIVCRSGLDPRIIKLPLVDFEAIDRWVAKYLELPAKEKRDELGDEHTFEHLGELSSLLEPLFQDQSPEVEPDATLVLCPTGSLSRIPIHAIPVNGKPLIERNPIVYCQSLPILEWLWQKVQNVDQGSVDPKACVINPMPNLKTDGKTPAASTPQVADLARSLDASLHAGVDVKKSAVLEAAQDASIFHYHGHITFNPRSALKSELLLNRTARLKKKGKNRETLTSQEFFPVRLANFGLAALIGCGSGMTSVSSTDDVLGWPTALLYAGAGSVVSSLWPIEDEDGIAFANAFYHALMGQRQQQKDENGKEVNKYGRKKFIDIAKAAQTAVLQLRMSTPSGEPRAPFHWAAFTVNGLWELPAHILPSAARQTD